MCEGALASRKLETLVDYTTWVFSFTDEDDVISCKRQGEKMKAVFWDVDNTLLLNKEALIESFIEIIRLYKNIDDEDCQTFHQNTFENIWKIVNKGEALPITKEKFSELSVDYYLNNMEGIKPRQAVAKYVPIFDKLGLKQAAISSAPRRILDANIKHLGFDNIFEFSISAHDVIERKPSPECYLMALEKMNINPEEVLVFEDSASGLDAATAAGLKTIYCPIGDDNIDHKVKEYI